MGYIEFLFLLHYRNVRNAKIHEQCISFWVLVIKYRTYNNLPQNFNNAKDILG